MARKAVPVEVNSFVGGLISDANPLTFSPNASLAEVNMALNNDGSRNRRLGMDFEEGSVEITTSMSLLDGYATSTFKWGNAGGIPEKQLLVVQFGNEIKIFDFDNSVLSSNVLFTHIFDVSTYSTIYSYAVMDGTLILVTGQKNINYLIYDSVANTISITTDYIRVRDMFGVADMVGTVDLRDGNNVTTRPTVATDTHIYNLRNQSFGKSLVCVTTAASDSLTKKDPLYEFFNQTSTYPSNADSVNQSLYPDANKSSNRTIDRFVVEDLDKTPIGTTQAATGYFIIDAMERGSSRMQVYSDMMTKYALTTNITTLPTDKTVGGPSVVAQFAGRVWYGGFSATVLGGDSKSPKLSSYLMFSQLVQDPTHIVKCYQDGDPTSKDNPDLLDTDGGFIKIDEAYGIKALITAIDSIFVFAENGVWRVTGGLKDSGFTATNYSVKKITNMGCINASSIVLVEGSLFYWNNEGIYIIGPNAYGDWICSSLIINRLQNFYNDISSSSKIYAQGFYDVDDRKIRWIYDSVIGEGSSTKELIFDTQLKAFCLYEVNSTGSDSMPKLAGLYKTPSFRFTAGVDDIQAGGVDVTVSSDQVTIGSQVRESIVGTVGYFVITGTTPFVKYRFSYYRDITFTDWVSYDGVGIDAEGYLLTGYLSGGDFQRQKQAPVLTMYMNKTETGFSSDSNGDLYPVNPSSVLIQTQWEWTNEASSNRWGTTFQGYRHRRLYMPTDVTDSYNDGEKVVVTKNKLRGKGRVLSMKLSTEPKKDFHVLGWSLMVEIMTNV